MRLSYLKTKQNTPQHVNSSEKKNQKRTKTNLEKTRVEALTIVDKCGFRSNKKRLLEIDFVIFWCVSLIISPTS